MFLTSEKRLAIVVLTESIIAVISKYKGNPFTFAQLADAFGNIFALHVFPGSWTRGLGQRHALPV